MDVLLSGFRFFVSEPLTILLLIYGVFFGIIFGCIPGLTATLGIILMIPFTYGIPAELGLSMLIGIYVGGISGGLITAILLNIPGTPSSMVTCWDGYPMAKKGLAGTALSLGVFSSMIGGVLSALALIFIAPPLSSIALKFGSWEYLSLMVLGMSVVIMMTSDSPLKGLIAAFLGITLSIIGIDVISGVSRLTFGFWQLQAGLEVTAISMAFFAVREILVQVKDFGKEGKKSGEIEGVKDKIPIIPPKETLKNTGPSFVIGSIYGTIIGMLPGVGQTQASMLTYNTVRQISKQPDKFGTGIPEGIVASETANNAVNGGALIPLLTLGIPGDMVTAVLIGGLMIHGIRPGPLLFRTEPGVVGSIMIAYFLANIFMFIMEIGFMRIFVKISKVPLSILFPLILISCMIGIYAMNNRIFDLWILVIFGIIGYFLTECGVPLPPLILGYILGKMIESSFRTAMYASGGDILDVINHPIALIFLIIAVILALMPYISKLIKRFFKSTCFFSI